MKTALTHKLLKLTPIKILIWLEAAVLLGFARLLVWALPFKYWVKLVGQPMSTSNAYERQQINPKSLSRIQWAVKSAAYRVPWQAVCLPQAMVVKWMLGFRGQRSKLCLGLKADGLRADPQQNNKLAAHAWLDCGPETTDNTIIGKAEEKFTKVTHFI